MGNRKRYNEGPGSAMFSGLPNWLVTALTAGTGSRKDIRKGSSLSANQQAEAAINWQSSERDRQWQEEMYNKYESPSAQVQQYKDAGLNVGMMYGGAGGSSSGVQSSGPAEGVTPGGDTSNTALNDLIAMLGAFSGLASDAAGVSIQDKNADTNRINATSDAALKSEQQKTEQAKQAYYKSQTTAQDNANSVFAERMSWERVNQTLRELQAEAGMRATYQQIKESEQRVTSMRNNDKLQQMRYDADYSKIKAEISKIYSDISVNDQEIEESAARTANTNQATDNLKMTYQTLAEDLKSKGYTNNLNDLCREYGVTDPAVALFVDSYLDGIDNERQQAEILSYIRGLAAAGQLSAKSAWQLLDKTFIRLNTAAAGALPYNPITVEPRSRPASH